MIDDVLKQKIQLYTQGVRIEQADKIDSLHILLGKPELSSITLIMFLRICFFFH